MNPHRTEPENYCFFVCWGVVIIYFWEKPRSHLQRWNLLYFLKIKMSILWLTNSRVFYKQIFFSPLFYASVLLSSVKIPLCPLCPSLGCITLPRGWTAACGKPLLLGEAAWCSRAMAEAAQPSLMPNIEQTRPVRAAGVMGTKHSATADRGREKWVIFQREGCWVGFCCLFVCLLTVKDREAVDYRTSEGWFLSNRALLPETSSVY